MAMRTLSSYTDSIQHALGGTMDSRHTATQMVNDAGRFLFRMHPWPWRERPPLTLQIVSGQEYILLPADFGDVLDVSVPNGVIYTVVLTSIEQVEARRNYAQFDAYRFFMAVAYPGQGSDDRGAERPRLEIYPSTGTNSPSSGFTLMYRANWVELDVNKTDSVPNILPEYERLLLEICRAMARGIEDDEELLSTPSIMEQFTQLATSAGLVQSSLGPMRGGAVEHHRGSNAYWPHRRITRA